MPIEIWRVQGSWDSIACIGGRLSTLSSSIRLTKPILQGIVRVKQEKSIKINEKVL